MAFFSFVQRRALCLITLMGAISVAHAQSSRLPPCPEPYTEATWHNCQGTRNFAGNQTYVGEFRQGLPNGRGTRSYPGGDQYIGEERDGKKHGMGTYNYANGARYVGEYADDKANGQGTYTTKEGQRYVGAYRDGMRNGFGTYTFPNGEKYVGEFRNNDYHGVGTLTYADGRRYVGEWQNDKRHGQGIEYQSGGAINRTGIWDSGTLVRSLMVDPARFAAVTGPVATSTAASRLPACPSDTRVLWNNCVGSITHDNGGRYNGEWRNDKFHGQGTYVWTTGAIYTGEYRDGKHHGLGTYTLADGKKYVGEFRDGNFNGRGVYYWPNGETHTGEFRDDKFNGPATRTFPDGSRFVGEYRDDKRHGPGIDYRADGSIERSGVWQNGEFVRATTPEVAPSVTAAVTSRVGTLAACPNGAPSPAWVACFGTYTYPDGRTYVGEWRQGKRNGPGTTTVADGRKYVGEFRDDKPHGQGNYTWPNGQKYVGEFRDGVPAGQGVYTYVDGGRYTGEFRDGRKNGQGSYVWPDGERYAGEFREDKRHGLGTQTSPDNRTYVGEWQEDKRNGQGVMYRPNGSIERAGLWSNGDFLRAAPIDMARYALKPVNLLGLSPTPSAATAATSTTPAAGNVDSQRVEAEVAKRVDAERQRMEDERRRQAQENERLRAEAEAAKLRQREMEAALALAQQNAKPGTARPSVALNAHALVIGNAAYAGKSRLDNPINDAQAMAEKLRSLGFKVTEVTDASRAKLVSEFSRFGKSAYGADVTLLFYAGHGAQISGTNYMLPTDIDMNDFSQVPLTGVSLNSVVEQYLPGKTKLVFLDACRDNPLIQNGGRTASRGLAPISVAEGTLIAYATKDGQVAKDGAGARHSPFTAALLEHLADPQDIAVVLRKVREKVLKATKGEQQPWDYGSLTGGELILSTIRPTTGR